MRWRCYSQTLLLKIKIEHISVSIVQSFTWFNFTVFQAEDYRNILKLSCRPLAFTTYKPFLKNKKRSRNSFAKLTDVLN